MSSETFTYKGISAGKYVEGTIEALSQDEANFKLKEQKIIITNISRTKKKAAEKKKKSGGGFLVTSLKRKNNVNKTQWKAINSCSFTCLWR